MVCVKWQAQCLAYSDWSVTVSSCWWWSLHRLKILAHTRQKTQVYPTILSIDIYGAHRLCSEKAVATHSSALAWRIPGTEEPGGLLSVASHRVRHDWCDLAASDCVLRSLGSGTSLPIPFGLVSIRLFHQSIIVPEKSWFISLVIDLKMLLRKTFQYKSLRRKEYQRISPHLPTYVP